MFLFIGSLNASVGWLYTTGSGQASSNYDSFFQVPVNQSYGIEDVVERSYDFKDPNDNFEIPNRKYIYIQEENGHLSPKNVQKSDSGNNGKTEKYSIYDNYQDNEDYKDQDPKKLMLNITIFPFYLNDPNNHYRNSSKKKISNTNLLDPEQPSSVVFTDEYYENKHSLQQIENRDTVLRVNTVLSGTGQVQDEKSDASDICMLLDSLDTIYTNTIHLTSNELSKIYNYLINEFVIYNTKTLDQNQKENISLRYNLREISTKFASFGKFVTQICIPDVSDPLFTFETAYYLFDCDLSGKFSRIIRFKDSKTGVILGGVRLFYGLDLNSIIVLKDENVEQTEVLIDPENIFQSCYTKLSQKTFQKFIRDVLNYIKDTEEDLDCVDFAKKNGSMGSDKNQKVFDDKKSSVQLERGYTKQKDWDVIWNKFRHRKRANCVDPITLRRIYQYLLSEKVNRLFRSDIENNQKTNLHILELNFGDSIVKRIYYSDFLNSHNETEIDIISENNLGHLKKNCILFKSSFCPPELHQEKVINELQNEKDHEIDYNPTKIDQNLSKPSEPEPQSKELNDLILNNSGTFDNNVKHKKFHNKTFKTSESIDFDLYNNGNVVFDEGVYKNQSVVTTPIEENDVSYKGRLQAEIGIAIGCIIVLFFVLYNNI